ncbi:MAG: 50S ribosomal protein P1, partial [Thermoplasmata archaeon]|nr:50S ribosomal protein P1 [Thermoplasmata archaeon]
MEYVYSVLILHSMGQQITEENVENIIKAAGGTPDKARIKALISSLEGVNIDEAIKATSFAPAAAPQAPAEQPKEEKKEEKKEKKEEKKEEEEA